MGEKPNKDGEENYRNNVYIGIDADFNTGNKDGNDTLSGAELQDIFANGGTIAVSGTGEIEMVAAPIY